MFEQQTEFSPWLTRLRQAAAIQRWRYLVVLSGSESWGLSLCATCPDLLDSGTVWLSGEAPEGGSTIAFKQANTLLGSETANVVFDAWCGFHPNAFAALAGTIRAGGVMVLLTPELDSWSRFDDPDYQRMDVLGFSGSPEKRFLRYLAQELRADERVLQVVPGAPFPDVPGAQRCMVAQSTARPADDCLTDEQAQAVAAVERVVHGHRNRPLVLCADRGRGKTAALGIACARLLRQQVTPILVTAPLVRNIEPLFERASALLPDARWHEGVLSWRGSSIRYLAPDHLLDSLPAARLLLVDEAAAIPTPLLGKMLDHYHRLVFTTTVHGYEGTGRGFAIRFQAELSRRMPQWRYMTLFAPVRWGQGDPLESSVNRLLLLQADVPADPIGEPPTPHPHGTQQRLGIDCAGNPLQRGMVMLDAEQLLTEPGLLPQVFGLLMIAHYRTTPDDLRLLLDGPNMRIAMLYENRCVAGVVLFACEGQLQSAMVDALQQGLRRPRGHLLPQTLLAQTGCASLLMLAGWRIVRIAVHPVLQRKGRGLLLLRWLSAQAVAQGVDYLGSSFGATVGLIDFWHRAGFTPLCLGTRRDAASGAHALVVARPLTAQTRSIVCDELQRFAEVLPLALGDSLRALESGVAAALLRVLPLQYPLNSRDREDVSAFVAGARTYQACYLALWKAALGLLGDATSDGAPDDAEVRLLVSKLLQRDDWSRAVGRNGVSGKAQLIKALRQLFA